MAFGDFTVTRASTKLRIGSNGLYGSVANNVPAFEFNTDGTYRGLLVEPGATNSIRNNSMTGAVAGTPGTLPTNWSEALSGLTREVVAIGTELGINYIDIKLSGTASGISVVIASETNNSIVASVGQVWTNSHFVKIVSAPTPPTSFGLVIREALADGTFVASGSGAIVPTSTLARYSHTRTLTGVTTARVQPQLTATVVNGNTYDFTVRIGWPQMETGSVATSPIVTTAGTASRVADVVSLTGASSLIGQSAGTIFAEINLRNMSTGIFRRIVELSDGGTTNNISMFVGDTVSTIGIRIDTGGVNQSNFATASAYSGTVKIALAYANNDIVLYVNGVQTNTDALASIPLCSVINIGSRVNSTLFANDYIRAVALFPTRIANATLISLTTP
jgi:hypothetical protein